MKRILAIVCASAVCAGAETTIYGATGLQFVPTGDISEDQDFGVSASASMDNDPSVHTSMRGAWLEHRLEIALANTWAMVDNDSSGFRPRTTSGFPIVPSIKYVLDHDGSSWQSWSYAVGFSMPYGVYGAVTWALELPLLSPSITAGMGTPIKTFHTFGGARLDLCDLDGNRLPVSLLADASYGGSTRTLGESAEAFWAVGVSTAVGRNLTFRAFHRRDRSYDAPPAWQNPGTSYLQLAWNFDGVKVAAKHPLETKQ